MFTFILHEIFREQTPPFYYMRCVSGSDNPELQPAVDVVSMPHAALYVSGQQLLIIIGLILASFNAARGIMCVGTSGRS